MRIPLVCCNLNFCTVSGGSILEENVRLKTFVKMSSRPPIPKSSKDPLPRITSRSLESCSREEKSRSLAVVAVDFVLKGR